MSADKTGREEKRERRRVLILASKMGYQTRGFAEAAEKLGVAVVFGTDRCHQMENPWGDDALALQFENPREAAGEIARAFGGNEAVDVVIDEPIDAVIALGDRPTTTAAYAAQALGVAGNSPEAAEICRSKLRQRETLRDAGVRVPDFFSIGATEDFSGVLGRVKFPCVVKPLSLAASQGVIRANNGEEFAAAVRRIRGLLESPEIQVMREPGTDRLLVETFVPGREVAVEGLMERGRLGGRLRVLAIFDKPDPLEGPYFEETIYVTPSRLPAATQAAIAECAQRTVRALGLTTGPVHAEFRVNEDGPWVLEAAPRPIGGLCSRALRFGPERISLEELLLRDALGLPGSEAEREEAASGVMMIPVPRSGIFEGAGGLEDAEKISGVTEIRITARLRDYVAAWPEGASYLGFIFARGESAGFVEEALRAAHGKLQFRFSPRLAVEHPVTGKIAN